MADNKLLDKLQGFKDKLNPQTALIGLAQSMLPDQEQKLVEKIEEMERPESEGGKLSEGWEKVTYSVTAIHGKLNISAHKLKRDDQGNMIMSPPFDSFNLIEFLTAAKHEQGNSQTTTGK